VRAVGRHGLQRRERFGDFLADSHARADGT
jgi:hypothetical protein